MNNNSMVFALIVIAIVALGRDKIPFLGRLPGDIELRWRGIQIYFPIVSALVVGFILSKILGRH